MPFQPATDTYQLAVKGVMSGGVPWVNTFHVYAPAYSPPSQVVADALAVEIDEAYTNLQPFMHTDWDPQEVVFTDLRTEGAAQYTSTISVTGSGSGAPLPNTVALCCSWTTGTRGRSFRGRTFLSGWTEAASDGNGPSSGALAAAQDFCDDILGDLAVRVLSRVHDGQPRAAGILTEITAFNVDAVWDTMRSRKLRSG